MDYYNVLTHLMGLLLVIPLIKCFRNAQGIAGVWHIFCGFDPVKQVGLLCIAVVLVSTVTEMIVALLSHIMA